LESRLKAGTPNPEPTDLKLKPGLQTQKLSSRLIFHFKAEREKRRLF